MNISFDSFECKQNCVVPRDALHDLSHVDWKLRPFLLLPPLPPARPFFPPTSHVIPVHKAERWAKKRLLALLYRDEYRFVRSFVRSFPLIAVAACNEPSSCPLYNRARFFLYIYFLLLFFFPPPLFSRSRWQCSAEGEASFRRWRNFLTAYNYIDRRDYRKLSSLRGARNLISSRNFYLLFPCYRPVCSLSSKC